jgi:hypothetical protein
VFHILHKNVPSSCNSFLNGLDSDGGDAETEEERDSGEIIKKCC